MIWIVLVVFVILVAVALVISGAVFTFLRFRTGSGVRIPLRLLLRFYIYVVIIVGLLLLTQGVTELVRAGLAGAGGKDFSYRPVFVKIPSPREAELRAPKPVELKEHAELTEEELEELSRIIAEREVKSLEERREARRKGLDRALKEGIIGGVTFTIVGALIWIAHVMGRGWLETTGERESPINRIYLVLVVVIFGVITMVNLPQGISEGFRFYLLDPLDEFSRGSPPGDKLGLAIATAPIWIIYLAGAIRAVKRGS